MSKRKVPRKGSTTAQPRNQQKRRMRSLLLISVILILSVSGIILARWRSETVAKQVAAVAPALQPLPAAGPSLAPVLLAKDYIYVGGRLVATEAQTSNSAVNNGAVTEVSDDPSSQVPPVVYTDMAVFRPSEGAWYVHNTVDGSLTAQMWGMAGDKPVPGDYDGDAKVDFAVFRPSDHTWYILKSSDGQMSNPVWGDTADEPVPGDYDGDGKTDVAVRRGSTWYIVPSSNTASYIAQQWGADTDLAVPGDYDGDGKTDIATFRPSDATWTILKSSSPEEAPETITQQWGESADLPQVGDYDGDNITDYATFGLSDTIWRIFSSLDSSSVTQQWGLSTDKPVPGDYDGDGKTDIAVVRPRVSETDNHSTWYILKSSDGGWMVAQWGADGDIAVPGKYNRVTQVVCTNCT